MSLMQFLYVFKTIPFRYLTKRRPASTISELLLLIWLD